jgi:hypothetical protein
MRPDCSFPQSVPLDPRNDDLTTPYSSDRVGHRSRVALFGRSSCAENCQRVGGGILSLSPEWMPELAHGFMALISLMLTPKKVAMLARLSGTDDPFPPGGGPEPLTV